MKYNVAIVERTGFLTRIETEDRVKLYNLRQTACQFASGVKFNDLPEDITHLVYYYEKGSEVHIYNVPDGCTEEEFDRFVRDYRPDFVGARHRLVAMM